jgi:hypothetical protein
MSNRLKGCVSLGLWYGRLKCNLYAVDKGVHQLNQPMFANGQFQTYGLDDLKVEIEVNHRQSA